MAILFRGSTDPDSINELAVDVHNPAEKIRDQGLALLKGWEAKTKSDIQRSNEMLEALRAKSDIEAKYRERAYKSDLAENKRYTGALLKNLETEAENHRIRGENAARKGNALANIVSHGSSIGISLHNKAKERAQKFDQEIRDSNTMSGLSLGEQNYIALFDGTLQELYDSDVGRKAKLEQNIGKEGHLTRRQLEKFMGSSGYTKNAMLYNAADLTAQEFPAYVQANWTQEIDIGSEKVIPSAVYKDYSSNPTDQVAKQRWELTKNTLNKNFFKDQYAGSAFAKKYPEVAPQRQKTTWQRYEQKAGAKHDKIFEQRNAKEASSIFAYELIKPANQDIPLEVTALKHFNRHVRDPKTNPYGLDPRTRRNSYAQKLSDALNNGTITIEQFNASARLRDESFPSGGKKTLREEWEEMGAILKKGRDKFLETQRTEIETSAKQLKAIETGKVNGLKEHVLKNPEKYTSAEGFQVLMEQAAQLGPAAVQWAGKHIEKIDDGLDKIAAQKRKDLSRPEYVKWVMTNGSWAWRQEALSKADEGIGLTPQTERGEVAWDGGLNQLKATIDGKFGGVAGQALGTVDGTRGRAHAKAEAIFRTRFAFHYKKNGNDEIAAANDAATDVDELINSDTIDNPFRMGDPTKNKSIPWMPYFKEDTETQRGIDRIRQLRLLAKGGKGFLQKNFYSNKSDLNEFAESVKEGKAIVFPEEIEYFARHSSTGDRWQETLRQVSLWNKLNPDDQIDLSKKDIPEEYQQIQLHLQTQKPRGINLEPKSPASVEITKKDTEAAFSGNTSCWNCQALGNGASVSEFSPDVLKMFASGELLNLLPADLRETQQEAVAS